jgi:hypothetical protein
MPQGRYVRSLGRLKQSILWQQDGPREPEIEKRHLEAEPFLR